MAASLSQAETAAVNCRNEGLDVALVKVGCLGSSEAVETSRKSFEQTNQSFPVPDDDRTLVLGLGPMPNLYSAGSQSSSGKRVKLSATLFSQHCTTTDPGLVVGTSGGSSRNLQSTTVPGRKEHPHKRKNCIVFPLIDEGSTSTKRKSGDYELSPLFAPRSNHICIDGKSPEADVQEHIGTGYEADHDRSLDQHEVWLSPEPSETTGCSFVATSDTVDCTDNVGQKSHQRRLKKCRFNGCSKGGRGASGLCISHGGGHRCQKPGCNKGAESRTAYCKSHGGGKRCQELGCTKSAEGKTVLHCSRRWAPVWGSGVLQSSTGKIRILHKTRWREEVHDGGLHQECRRISRGVHRTWRWSPVSVPGLQQGSTGRHPVLQVPRWRQTVHI